MRSKGSMLGAAGMIVFDDRRDMIQAAHNAIEFFAHEFVWEVLPLPDRHAALGGATGRQLAHDLKIWLEEVNDLERDHEGGERVWIGHGRPTGDRKLDSALPRPGCGACRASERAF